jgi:tRNA(Ile)-lysidine synthase
LVNIFKSEIVNFCTENNVKWCEDSSNSENFYLRNRIRNITNQFDEIFQNRNWRAGFLSTYQQISDDNAHFENIIAAYDCDSEIFNVKNISSPSILRRAIKKWLKNTVITKQTFDLLINNILCGNNITLSINKNLNIKYCNNRLSLEKISQKTFRNFEFKTWVHGTIFLPNGYKLTKKIVEININNLKTQTDHSRRIFINKNLQILTIRTYQNGDRMQPINCKHSKKLKDLFSDKHISQTLRHELPIITDENNNIIWVPNLPTSEISKILANQNCAMEITYEK